MTHVANNVVFVIATIRDDDPATLKALASAVDPRAAVQNMLREAAKVLVKPCDDAAPPVGNQ